MSGDMVKGINLIEESFTNLLTVQFSKSSSQSYRLAVNVSEGAGMYQETKIGAHTIHTVVFRKNREDAARAVALLQYVAGWKSTLVYGGGKLLQDRYKTSQVLRCYLEAAACEDWKAHCYVVIDDPFEKSKEQSGIDTSIIITADAVTEERTVEEYIFPCKFLNPHFRRMNQKHPSAAVHQIQAAAIAIGCDMCPYFNAKGYENVGLRKKGRCEW